MSTSALWRRCWQLSVTCAFMGCLRNFCSLATLSFAYPFTASVASIWRNVIAMFMRPRLLGLCPGGSPARGRPCRALVRRGRAAPAPSGAGEPVSKPSEGVIAVGHHSLELNTQDTKALVWQKGDRQEKRAEHAWRETQVSCLPGRLWGSGVRPPLETCLETG